MYTTMILLINITLFDIYLNIYIYISIIYIYSIKYNIMSHTISTIHIIKYILLSI